MESCVSVCVPLQIEGEFPEILGIRESLIKHVFEPAALQVCPSRHANPKLSLLLSRTRMMRLSLNSYTLACACVTPVMLACPRHCLRTIAASRCCCKTLKLPCSISPNGCSDMAMCSAEGHTEGGSAPDEGQGMNRQAAQSH